MNYHIIFFLLICVFGTEVYSGLVRREFGHPINMVAVNEQELANHHRIQDLEGKQMVDQIINEVQNMDCERKIFDATLIDINTEPGLQEKGINPAETVIKVGLMKRLLEAFLRNLG